MQLNRIININKKYNSILLKSILLLALLTLFLAGTAAAETFSLEQALNHGLEKNLEIRQQQNSVESIERQLKTIRAQQGWQIEVSANYNEIVDQPENNSYSGGLSMSSSAAAEGGEASLSINRNFSSGFSLSQTAEIDDQGESDYTVNIAYPLFKGVPTESEKAYYEQEKNLLREKNSLNSLLEEKIAGWLDNYLQLLRLEKSRENAELELKTAEQSYRENKKLFADSQISKSELKNSEAELIDAENNYAERKNQFNNALKSFKLTLGMNESSKIELEAGEYLGQVKNNLIDYQQYDFEKMYQSLLAADYDLRSAAVNLELKRKQLQWFQNEGRAEIRLNGSYNYSAETSTLGFSVSYDLFDGGQREYNQQNLISNLKLAEDSYENIKDNKKIALEKQLNNLHIAEREIKSSKLKLSNAENNFRLAEEQYQAALITENEYKKQKLAYQKRRLAYQQAKDKLFIEKLNLTMLINNQYIDKNRGAK